MLKNTQSAIRGDILINKLFQTTTGVVQGSVISPLLYGVFIDDLIIELQAAKCGIDIFKENISAPTAMILSYLQRKSE